MAVNAVIQFGVGIVLARLLPPSEFGLAALAYLFGNFAHLLTNLGLPAAVVQRSDLTSRHIRTAFTLSVILGVLVAGLIWILAPLSVYVFDEPRLPLVLKVLAGMYVFIGIGNTAGALLQRRLDFRTLLFVSVGSYVLGYIPVSVGLAVLGYGVWALIGSRFVLVILQTILLLLFTRHPLRPLLARIEAKNLVGFGTGRTISDVLQYLARSGDKFVVGRWLGGATPLGLYNRAYQQMRLPTDNLGQLFTAVLFPAFAQLQGERKRLGVALLRSTELATLLSAPIMVGMVIAAPHLIVGVYGPNWAGSVEPFQVIAAAGVLATLYPIATSAVEAMGRVYAVSVRSGIFALTVIVLGLAALPWGLSGVAASVVAAHAVVYVLAVELAVRTIGIERREYLRAHVSGLAVASAVGLAAMPTRLILEYLGIPSLAILFVLIAVCAVAMWAGIRWLPGPLRPDLLVSDLLRSVPRLPGPISRGLGFLLGVSLEKVPEGDMGAGE